MADSESQPLLTNSTDSTETAGYGSNENQDEITTVKPNIEIPQWCTANPRLLFTLLFVTIASLIATTLVLSFCVFVPNVPDVDDQSVIRILSLSVWGSPASFGTLDKEVRIAAIGDYIRAHNDTYDVILLQELWMRPDHASIMSALSDTGLVMTYVGDLASSVCDGRVAPTSCSGLAVVTKFKMKNISFQPYSVSGDFWWHDGEYFAKKGIGRVRVSPEANVTVDIFLTSLAASDYNKYYRQIQAEEFGEAARQSDADVVIAAGNMEIDPRTSETSYKSIRKGFSDSRQEYLVDRWFETKLATYGNAKNLYSSSSGPLVYDHFFHKSESHKIKVEKYSVPILKTQDGRSFSNHEAVSITYKLIK